MPKGAREAVAALRRSHDELVAFVQGLDRDELERQSGASEWTVAQVLSHLGSASEIGLSTVTAGKADMDGAPVVWARWNAMSPTEQAANFALAEERLVEALEALDDETLATKRVDLGFLPAPVDIGFLVVMRLTEQGLHRWDIEVSFDPVAGVTDYMVPFMLRQLPMFASFFAKPIGRSSRIDIETIEPSKHFLLELGDDGGRLSEGSSDEAQTRARLPAEAFLRLTSGRLSPDHTPAAVTVEGDLSLEDLRRVFPGY
jgi:uncharacterized protein (TIGR03083 family)